MDLNRANRQCCDLDIRDYKTNAPILFVDFCNTTTAGFTGDNVYANIKGSKAIAFHNPIEGTMTIEFQCHPFKVYALLSDGVIETTGIDTVKQEITATEEGKLTLTGTPKEGTVFVYKDGEWGESEIKGSVTSGVFTATTADEIVVGDTYLVGYLEEKSTGVRKVSFNNKKVPKDLRLSMQTLDKDENGDLIPCKLTAYKASPQRSLDLSFASDSDPTSITMTFNCLEDANGNVMDIMEIKEA